MNGFAALDIPPCRRYVVVKATAGFAVCRLILKLLLFYSCLDFTQNLGKTQTANRAARVFIVDFYSGNIARVHSSMRFHFSEIQSYYSLFLQILTFTSHLPTHEKCTPVRFWFAVYSRSAGFIRALFARLRVFSVNSAQTMPSQRIFSVNPGKSA